MQSVHSVLTDDAIKEIATLLKSSRRRLSDFYRKYDSGLSLEEIAKLEGDFDLKRVKSSLSTLRIIFGRDPLPKRGSGRQQAVYEADFWLKSDTILSDEVTAYFETILVQAERTNTRRKDIYDPPLPPTRFTLKDRPKDGDDYSAVYVLTRKSFLRDAEGNKKVKVKIGWSHKVWDRIASAQTWDPEPLNILRVFPCINPNIVESKMHIVLDTLNLGISQGGGIEWFEASLDLIDEIADALDLSNSLVE